ncbi:ribonuclease inhibitor [Paraflavitalea soli]|uniref:Ribonuclease inhibitor n=1 Tax=Paraflavitalea soli TaxID=2315862 RepID=A0A3B7MY12_9BACT|nr:c-type cytochrome domain-containing protein [Paraflavitalea soli]AXY78433.1 ribonuclease inhibitor [Paraflavitalea soli]
MVLAFLDEWVRYLGHFHPVVVHLPIGMLVVAFIMELLVWRNRQLVVLNGAIVICLLAGCISAILSCLVGWFLSMEGGYEESTLSFHQWMGISVAVLSGICWFIKRRYALMPRVMKGYRLVFIALILLLTVTGHMGGNMTHGEDYLTAGLPQPVAGWLGMEPAKDTAVIIKKNISDIKTAVVYTDLVQPIFQEKCYSCHSSKKVKGGLRMDQEPLLFKGGKHGVVIRPGDEAGSELTKRLLLPLEDDKRMPPKDQPALTAAETVLLRWWVRSGADTKKKVSELSPDSTTLALLHGFQQGGGDTLVQVPLSPVYAATVAAPDPNAMLELTKLGVLVTPVAKNKQLLDVSCINFSAFDDRTAALLLKLSGNIVWLRLDNTRISDKTLEVVGQLKQLVRLNLVGTSITSAGIDALKNLSHLEYINLTATKVDDAGLRTLASLPALQQIYCWQSLITDNAMTAFRKSKPSIHLVGGANAKS